ncbi:hypothetical protein BU26DRAFT_561919 [Trematosphaeria pertusa]|uniref:DUF7730 domain-containing protein n=1 Tax=Trematosphaeria pertusa TaxID=390896 RepID=A0A6A6IQT2_9PLEO|nr:uncharacterized protein BU26DRAFT_561919 [Trematosphaeria pertusa]KAF2252152.1 hypothetical protein BU26DRAFT_561919 [Trematosphaeria pertusa]
MASNRETEAEGPQIRKDSLCRAGFLDLPRELRDLIYEFALRVAGAIFIFSQDSYGYRPILKARVVKYKNDGPPEPQHIDEAIPVGLLRTCRQIHSESTEVLYSCNIFRLYMSNADFAPSYCSFVRHITFTMEAGRGIYSDDRETMGYWWRRVFWPNILERSANLLRRFPNLETLTFPIKSNQVGHTWRPAFTVVEQKTREQRIDLAARWLKVNCPLAGTRLRDCLRLEIMPSAGFSKDEYKGSWFFPEDDEDEWDYTEFAEAFDMMKRL